MLKNRILTIAALMMVGLLMLSISTWLLAFDPHSSAIATWSGTWILQRLPVLIGLLLIIAGFRLLSATKVPTQLMSDDDPAP